MLISRNEGIARSAEITRTFLLPNLSTSKPMGKDRVMYIRFIILYTELMISILRFIEVIIMGK
ncbi:hypothetical protein SACC_08860 [Saccharolobus caldissimus]|uniref:Uncharacterized protein n=1 Tax=Saccharolobus caldissimus TaxID=1702097 RepID=A0AAQ4CPY8_9CREN|nr:hypothetical protein SACC_08860 [Saccharolobus caldissimus]